jgi:hypothetical protein
MEYKKGDLLVVTRSHYAGGSSIEEIIKITPAGNLKTTSGIIFTPEGRQKPYDAWYHASMRKASPEDVIRVRGANRTKEIVDDILRNANGLSKVPLGILESFYKELQAVLEEKK